MEKKENIQDKSDIENSDEDNSSEEILNQDTNENLKEDREIDRFQDCKKSCRTKYFRKSSKVRGCK